MALIPTQVEFKLNEETNRLEPVPGTEKKLEQMDIGTVFVFTEAIGRIGEQMWMGPKAGIQLSHDITILGKVELTSDTHENGERVRNLIDKFWTSNRMSRLHQESFLEYKTKYPERWARDIERSKVRYGESEVTV